MKEQQFLNNIVQLAHLHGWMVAHFRPAKTDKGWRTPVSADGKGFPDLLLIHPQRGKLLVIEVKIPPNHLSEEQKDWIDWFQEAGVSVIIAKPEDWDYIVRTLSDGHY